VIAALLSATNIPSALETTPEGEVGPPFVVLLVATVLGVVGLVTAILAWRSGSPVALRVLAACLIVLGLTALPGLFVDIPSPVKAAVGGVTLLTVVCLVLLFSTDRRPAPVTD